MSVLFALAIGIFFGVGVFQLLRRDLIKAAMGFGILFTGVNLFILAVGAYDGQVAPYADLIAQSQRVPSDPLVQSLLLTAIVIGFGSYAMLLAMVNVISRRFHTIDSDEMDELQN
ncbi:MAG: sodium:proton antiporter [Phototrophicaceae bacterium]|jgi:multicomponent Na+:H+ antiporter subunit C